MLGNSQKCLLDAVVRRFGGKLKTTRRTLPTFSWIAWHGCPLCGGVNASTGKRPFGRLVASVEYLRFMHLKLRQYDFGSPSALSAMKFKIICWLTGAKRGIITSRK